MHLRLAKVIWKTQNEVDIWFFFGGECLLVPMLASKFLRKRVVIAMAGSSVNDSKYTTKNTFMTFCLSILSNTSFLLADKIIIHSSNLIFDWHLSPFRQKVVVASRHFIDFEKFQILHELSERDNLIGYIGRMSEEKGVLNLIKAMSLLSTHKDNVSLLLIGTGSLDEAIKRYIEENSLSISVKQLGWIEHDELPIYLNQMKLLVIPSYNEGLPNVMLEAMACGTPVLATPVGAIPEYIQDRVTGFLVSHNSPDCLAQRILETLEFQQLNSVSNNALLQVKNEFNYQSATERYAKIIEDIMQ